MSIPTSNPLPRLRGDNEVTRWAERLVNDLDKHLRDLILPLSVITLANGDNNNVALQGGELVRIIGPTAAFAITGIASGITGRIIVIHNTTGQNMTFRHQSGSSEETNRIALASAADETITGISTVWFIYENSRWRMICCAAESGMGTVTSVAGGVGITNTPDPIIGAGTVDLDINSLTSEPLIVAGDLLAFVDVSVGTTPADQRKVTFAEFKTALALTSGTVTSVAGGVGITNTPEPITGAGTVDLDINSLTTETTVSSGDLFAFVDVSVGTAPGDQRKATLANILTGLETIGINATTLDGLDSTAFQPIDADLTAIAALAGTGILSRTAANTWALTSGTAGRVLFWAVGGLIPDDDADLFWDDTNKRLGIHEATPLGPLHIGGTTERIILGDDITATDSVVIHGTETGITIGGTLFETRLSIHDESGFDAHLCNHKHNNDVNVGPTFLAARSLGTEAAETVVTDNCVLARFLGIGFDGTDYERAAQILFEIDDATPGPTSMGGSIVFSTTPSGATSLAEVMRITANARVAIGGITDPLAQFQIDGSQPIAVLHGHSATAANAGLVAFLRSRGSHAVPAAVNSADLLSTILTQGHDGTGYFNATSIETYAAQNWSGAQRGTVMLFFSVANGATAVAERFRVSETGNILIGTVTDVSTTRLRVIGGDLEAADIYGGTATSSTLVLEAHNGTLATSDTGRIRLSAFTELLSSGGTITQAAGSGTYNLLSAQFTWAVPTTSAIGELRGFNYQPTFTYDSGTVAAASLPAFRAFPIFQALASGDPNDGGFINGFEALPQMDVLAGRAHSMDFMYGMYSHPKAQIAAGGTGTFVQFVAYQAWGASSPIDTSNAGTLTADQIICFHAGNVPGVTGWGTFAAGLMVENLTCAPAGSRYSVLSRGSGQHMRHVGNTIIGIDAAVVATEKLRVHQPTIGNDVLRLETAATNDDPNYIVRHGRVATTDATVTTLMTYTLTAANAYLIEARVVAHRTGGAAGAADDSAAYVVYAGAKHTGGVAVLITAVGAAYTDEDQAAWNATIDVNGNDIRVRVTGAANNDVTWHCTLLVQNVGT